MAASSVLQSFLFANTPAYLYRKLREDASVLQRARESSADSLLQNVMNVAAAEAPSEIDVAQAYADLVSLTYKDAEHWVGLRDRLRSSPLRWGGDLLAIHELKTIPTQPMVLQAHSASSDARLPQSGSVTIINLSK